MDVNLNIENKDIALVKEYLKGKNTPVDLQDITLRVALFKTQENRAHKVKLYNPDCEYKKGDLIYKEYPGKIRIGSKKYIEIDHGVVLLVEAVRTRFGINEVKLKYEGTSEFKKHTSYLDRQKIELLLPHKQNKPYEKPQYLDEANDPRQQNAPLEPRDFNILKKKLVGILHKDSSIAVIQDKVLLSENLKPLGDEVFDKIREFLEDRKKSETTEFFVENFVRIKPGDEEFDTYCFSLSFKMMNDFKIDFQKTHDSGWGKWNLISVIYYMKKDSPISEPNPLMHKVSFNNRKNLSHRRRKFEEELFQDAVTRFYLTQREVSAGAMKLKPGFHDLGDSIEIEIVDGKQKKTYLIYYYKDDHLLLGFKEIFERYKAQQGAIITFDFPEPDSNEPLVFNIRTTKKGTISDHIDYFPEEKVFRVTEEKIASPVFVNKAMFLESTVFSTVAEKVSELRKIDSFNKLVHKIFLEFGVKERNYEIHILRLYHILDLIYPVNLKLVEEVILSNPEFVPAEKLSGVFYLDSGAVVEIEVEEEKRKEEVVDEKKKKKEELKKKKLEQEQRVKDEIRLKREERRRKREEEMWEKERIKVESREKSVAPEPEPKESPKTEAKSPEKEHSRRSRKRTEEESSAPKSSKRSERKPSDDAMSEEEIKSQIELEKLKDQLKDRNAPKKVVKNKKKVAYRDTSDFGGVFASKLDQLVKGDGDKEKK